VQRIWYVIQPPSGRGARRVVAGIMLIMGLGRLGLYATNPLTMTLPTEEYGILLTLLGALLYVHGRFRLSIGGRIVAGLSALLLAGIAWDVGTLGVTALLEVWLAVILLKEMFTSHDC
jgi:hypothetical protein